jgi:preprotein translocase subunit SecE
MARPPGNRPPPPKPRQARPPVVAPPSSGAAAATVDAPKKKVNIAQFAREVRAEGRKITWTSRKETWITSVMVLIMVILTALFFLVVDFVLSGAVNWILNFARNG